MKFIRLRSNHVLFFGRITKIKGVDLIIHAAKILSNVRFVIVGQGEMEANLMDLPNCDIVGFLNEPNLSRVIEKAYISVFPSIWYENCPMGIVESISLGTPVLGARIGGIPELIKENITGMTFSANNTSDFVDKIKFLISNRALVNKMSSNCLNSPFASCEQYSKDIVELYKKIISE